MIVDWLILLAIVAVPFTVGFTVGWVTSAGRKRRRPVGVIDLQRGRR